jgi:hypothetical protein
MRASQLVAAIRVPVVSDFASISALGRVPAARTDHDPQVFVGVCMTTKVICTCTNC